MSNNSGYIGLWREIRDHWIWEEDRPRTRAEAWIDIICEARYLDEPKQSVIKDIVLMCNYGESLNSLDTWAQRWRWNKSRVRRFFKLLEKEEQIVTVNETVTTRLIVCNYSKYDPKKQKTDTASETQVKRIRHASDTHSTPKEEGKEREEGKKGKKTTSRPQPIVFKKYSEFNAVTSRSKRIITMEKWISVVKAWKVTYPFDIDYQLSKANSWLATHPGNNKVDLLAFLDKWMSRARPPAETQELKLGSSHNDGRAKAISG